MGGGEGGVGALARGCEGGQGMGLFVGACGIALAAQLSDEFGNEIGAAVAEYRQHVAQGAVGRRTRLAIDQRQASR